MVGVLQRGHSVAEDALDRIGAVQGGGADDLVQLHQGLPADVGSVCLPPEWPCGHDRGDDRDLSRIFLPGNRDR